MKKKFLMAVPAVFGTVSMYAPMVAYAAEGSASSAVSDAVTVFTGIVPLFSTYPMNIFIGCGIAAAGLTLFAKARKTSGNGK